MFAKFAFAALLSAATLPAMAAQCEATIEGNDRMQYNLKEMTVDKSCEKFTVNLKHVGQLPVVAMGHNWVLTTTADKDAVVKEGQTAGADNDYLKPEDERVIAATDLIGGGEETSVTFDVSKLKEGEEYTYFCSFPGHWGVMTGTLKLGS